MRIKACSQLRMGLLCLVAALAGGCATSSPLPRSPVPPDAPDPPPPVRDVEVPYEASAEGPAGEPPPGRVTIAVVLDDSLQQQAPLLRVFSARLGEPYRVFNLARRDAGDVRRRLEAMAPARVVAVGPSALAAVDGLRGLEVVHAGVLDPGIGVGGVDALPDFTAQIDVLLREAPDLERLGVIGGAAMRERMAALAAASAARGLTLEQREVGSDKELLLAFRTMVPRIEAFVFLPDQAVLSAAVIEEVIAHGRRNGVQIVSYSPLMFELGADVFMAPDPVAVAEALVEVLREPDRVLSVSSLRYRLRSDGQATSSGTLQLAELQDD